MPLPEAIILAGGLGTRIRSEIGARPKCMAPVNGKPFLQYLTDYLKNQGVPRVIFSLGFGSQEVLQELPLICGSLDYDYVVEDHPLGTGGAVSLALTKVRGKQAYIINGDTMFTVDLTRLYNFHNTSHAAITLALKSMTHFDRYGTVDLGPHGQIKGFFEKKMMEAGLINGGISIIAINWWQSLGLEGTFSLEKEVLEKYCVTGEVYGLDFDEYFIDIGVPADYRKAAKEFSEKGFR